MDEDDRDADDAEARGLLLVEEVAEEVEDEEGW